MSERELSTYLDYLREKLLARLADEKRRPKMEGFEMTGLGRIPSPSRMAVGVLCFPMALGCFFFTWLNGHLVPSQVPEGIAMGIFFILAGMFLIRKERRLRRVKVA